MHHQYGISALVSQASFNGETIGSVIQGIPQLYHIIICEKILSFSDLLSWFKEEP